jgi:alanine racemase
MPSLQIRPTSAVIDLGALRHNVRSMRRVAGPEVGICAVVKANAYGHGITRVALEFEREGVEFLGVNTTEEGLGLREAGVAAPILVMGGVFADEHALVIAERLTPVVCRRDDLVAFARAAGDQVVPVHLKFDTGMGRLGFWPHELEEIVALCQANAPLRVEGLMTHFASADDPEREGEVRRQLALFAQIRERAARAGLAPRWIHAANSAGLVRFPEARLSLVRPGLLLYGALPSPDLARGIDVRPVMRVRTEVVHLREVPAGHPISYGGRYVTPRPSRMATLPIGYADGIPRRFSPGGEVLTRGRRAPVRGSVCMDMLMVDVTDIPGVSLGDEVVLLGRQGMEELRAEDLARQVGTIPYEVFCAFTARVPRIYRSSDEGGS